MIKICSFFSLPVEHARIGTVWSIANSCPRNIRGIEGQLRIFVPEWKSVKALREHRIGEEEFVAQYRELMRARWPRVKAWLASLDAHDEMYLCCWERVGFCHRYLVAKLLQKFRPDLEVRVT